MNEFLEAEMVTVLPHSPFSPDLARPPALFSISKTEIKKCP